MTLEQAENVKQKLEVVLNETTQDGLKEIEVFIAPANSNEFESFRKMWRNTTYVVALATFGHADMNVYVCDENYVANQEEFETLNAFMTRTKINAG